MKSLKKVRKKIFNKEVKMMKKLLYVGLIVAIVAFFTYNYPQKLDRK